MLTKKQIILKRIIDIILSVIGIIISIWLVVLLFLIVFFGVQENGLFRQNRIGQYGKPFRVYKIKSIYKKKKLIWFAKLIRKSKLDELPQLWNVLIGDMSIVGPRPDLEGFADQLEGEERIILKIKPGLTGPASLFFFDEEQLLSKQKDRDFYNRNVIWNKKVQMNIDYIKNYTLTKDLKYIIKTIFKMIEF